MFKKTLKFVFLYFNKTLKTHNKNLFDIRCLTCCYGISEGSKQLCQATYNTLWLHENTRNI